MKIRMNLQFLTNYPTLLTIVMAILISPSVLLAQEASTTSTLVPRQGAELLQDAVNLEHNTSSVCVLQDAGDVFCWQISFFGATGNNPPANEAGYETLNTSLNSDIASITMGDINLCGFGESSGVDCVFFGDEQFSQNPGLDNPIEPDASYVFISDIGLDQRTVCGIQTDNRAVCWGESAPIKNIPPEATYLKHVATLFDRACGIDLNDNLICWGEPFYESGPDLQFGDVDPSTIGTAKEIALSVFGACIVDANDELACYGEMDVYTEAYANQTITNIDTASTSGPLLCYESTDGTRSCEVVIGEPGSTTIESQLPTDTTALLTSSTGSICFTTTSREMFCSFPGNVATSQFPTAPQNLTVEAYSNTTAELFWSRPYQSRFSNDHLTGYEIYRDSVLIERLGVINSFFDTSANPNAAYEVRPLRGAVAGTVSSISLDGTNDVIEPTIPTEPTIPINNTIAAPILTGSVYSQTNLELFWNRISNPNVTYNVFRNNVPLATGITGTSFFDTDLSPGTSYIYGLSIELNGNIVAASSIELTTPGTALVTTGPGNAPEFSNAVRYSPTAVEIFWVRTPNTFTAFYELSRNGVLIDDQLDALSYYDSNAPSNQDWTYELVAVDGDGNRSEIASISVPADTTGSGTPPPVSGGIEPPDITGLAYSASDIEIFWPRIEGTNITYTVFRNDEPVALGIYGLSYFDTQLEPGTTYQYRVVVLVEGQEATSNTRSFTTLGI